MTMKISSNASAPFVVAIGKGVLQSIWPWWILGAFAALVIGVGLGLLSIIRTAVKRGRRKRELRRARQPYGGYPVPAYAGQYTYPPAGRPRTRVDDAAADGARVGLAGAHRPTPTRRCPVAAHHTGAHARRSGPLPGASIAARPRRRPLGPAQGVTGSCSVSAHG